MSRRKTNWYPERLDAIESARFIESKLGEVVGLLQETAEQLDALLEYISSNEEDRTDLVDDIDRIIIDAMEEYHYSMAGVPSEIQIEFQSETIPSWDSFVRVRSLIEGAQYMQAYRQPMQVADIARLVKARMTSHNERLLAGSLLEDIDAAEYDGIDCWLNY